MDDQSRESLFNPWVRYAIVVLGFVFVSGCRDAQVNRSIRLETVFHGYTLLCVDDIPTNIDIRELEFAKCRNRYPDDRVMVPGRVYIFRKDTTLDNEILATSVIPNRLIDAGATIEYAPKESKDFMHLFIGGPIYSIRFDFKGHRGTIWNRVHTIERDRGYWEELVAVLQ